MRFLTAKQILPFAIGLMLAGCTSTDEVGGGDGNGIIGFRSPATLRAAIESADDIAAGGGYEVWGYRTSAEGGSETVFDGVTVSRNATGEWEYTGEKKFWESGGTYRFYAFYPVNKASCNAAGETCSITYNVATEGIGTEAVDLMKAASTRAYDGTDYSPVSLTFNHLLSRVSVVVKKGVDWAELDGNLLTLEEVKMYGFGSVGTCNAPLAETPDTGGWQITGTVEESTTFFTDRQFPAVGTGGTDFGTDGVQVYQEMYAIPQRISPDMEITLRYNYRQYGETVTKESTVSLSQFLITSWMPGSSYRYVLTINPGGVTFTTMEVPDWTSSFTGGNVIVGNDPQN